MEFEYPDLNSMFWGQSKKFGSKIAYTYKRGDKWHSVSWNQYAQTVRELALGLLSLGAQKGQVLAIMSGCRPEWELLDRANLACGGITVGVYETNTAEQSRYILDHSEACIVAVENQAQLYKVESILDKLPGIKTILIFDVPEEKATCSRDLITLTSLLQKGAKNSESLGRQLANRAEEIGPQSVAAYVYTSGTTGPPKGAVLSHQNLLASGYILGKCMQLRPDDVTIIFLPFAHVLQRTILICQIACGNQTAYAESIPKLLDNLKDVQPTYFGSVPRMFEKAYSRIMENAAQSPPWKQKLFHTCLRIGIRRSRRLQAGKPIPLWDNLLYRIAYKLVFSKVIEALGGRVRQCSTGSAPIAIEILEFFHAAGMLPLEGYALTETCTLGSFNRADAYKFGTVGQVVPGMEAKIAEDGEICLKGVGLFKGYLKDPEKTREAIDKEGWFHTGDLGQMDDEGFITITGRKKDLIITSGGKNVAPNNIENLLKSHPAISQAMAYGDRKPYLTALITLNIEEMESFLEQKGITDRDNESLAEHPEVIKMVQEIVDTKNQELARFEQIKKFVILERDLLQEKDEITPTLKVKRNIVTKNFQDRLEALY